MSERGKEWLKEILEWFPFLVLAKVAEHIFYQHVLAGTLFTIVSMTSFYVFMRVKFPEHNKKDVWIFVGFMVGLLFLTMVFNKF